MNFLERFLTFLILLVASQSSAQQVDEDQWGLWTMGFFRVDLKDSPWGFQGDVQYRTHDLGADLEQLMLRAGATWRPKKGGAIYTVGYAHIPIGVPGEDRGSIAERRIHQEGLWPHHPGGRFFLNHRVRLEERWIPGLEFRTRLRYALFLNVPLNNPTLEPGTTYLAFYDEVFLNGPVIFWDDVGTTFYDRNRLYAAVGRVLGPHWRVQAGAMLQSTNTWRKYYWQLSAHLRL